MTYDSDYQLWFMHHGGDPIRLSLTREQVATLLPHLSIEAQGCIDGGVDLDIFNISLQAFSPGLGGVGRNFVFMPYSIDERRVAEWLVSRGGIGGGDDPIGFVLASLSYATQEAKLLNTAREAAIVAMENHDYDAVLNILRNAKL